MRKRSYDTDKNLNLNYKCAGTIIVFNSKFNGYLTTELIDIIKQYQELTLSNDFNRSVKMIPSSIINLTFGFVFNKRVNNFHSQMEKLYFKCNFNQGINYLPSSIYSLILGSCFNKSASNLPHEITKLTLGKNFNKSKTKFPIKLSNLNFIGNIKMMNKYWKLTNIHIIKNKHD
jgi:hypothetical protein